MPFIDDRGRLFGKVNLIDAAVGIFVLVLIPLGYSAYLLFRAPVPTIVSVEPAQIVEHQPATLRIQGTDLRPYLRARFGDTEFPFLVESTSAGMVRLSEEATRNNLPVGTYDLVLLDEARELVRKPGALSVVAAPSPPPPPPPPEVAVQVTGTFIGLSDDDVERFEVGVKLGPFVKVLAVLAPEPGTQRIYVPTYNSDTLYVDSPLVGTVQVPALLLIHCERTTVAETFNRSVQCDIGDTFVRRNDVIPIPTEDGTFDFVVNDVRPADAEIVFQAPSPPQAGVSVQVVGAFIGLSDEDVDRIKIGSRMGPLAEVLAVRAPERGTQRVLVLGRTTTEFVDTPFEDTVQVPAILRLDCEQLLREQCSIGDVPLVRDAVIPIPTENGTSNFVVTEVRPADALPVFQTGSRVVVQAFGAFTGLSVDEAASISVGSMFGAFAEVVAVGSPAPATDRVIVGGGTVASTPVGNKVQVPALLRLTCQRALDGQCTVGTVALVQDAVVELPVSGRHFASGSSQPEGRQVSFQVRNVQPADARIVSAPVTMAVATVRVRFIVHPEAVDLLNVGAVDVGTPLDARRATFTAIDSDQRQVTALGDFAAIPGQRFQFEQPMVVFTGTVRIPVIRAQSGWEYKGSPVKVGASFVFETVESLMEGAILAMTLESSPEMREWLDRGGGPG